MGVAIDTATDTELALAAICSRPLPADLGDEWERINGHNPFRGWHWSDAWSRHYLGSGSEPLVVTCRNGEGRLVGVAPWYATRHPVWGRTIRFLGTGEACGDYLSVLSEDGYADRVGRELARWLSETADHDWDLIELAGVRQDDSGVTTLINELRERGHEVSVRHVANCWRLALPDTWDEYVARLSRSRRDKVKQMIKKVFGTGRVVPRPVTNLDELARAEVLLHDLHQRRRESVGDAGCFASPAFGRFHAEVARRWLAAGQLRMHWIELDGRPVAIEYGAALGPTIFYYQSGVDPEMMRDKPGWLNFVYSIKSAIEQHYRWFDFLRGDEPYKASWRGEPQPLVDVRIVGHRAGAAVRNHAWHASRWAKHRLAGGLSRASQWLGRGRPATGEAKPEDG